MKFCSNCGVEVNENAVVCIKCGCAIAGNNIQNVNIINPNDAPSRGFAILGFFFPLVGFILWLAWNNSSPKKAKSCGKGALIGIIIIPIIALAIILISVFLTTASVITYNVMNQGEKSQTEIYDPNSPYAGISATYSYYDQIGQITTRTNDFPIPSTVTVELILGYDLGDQTASSELTSRRFELRDFTRRYFAGKSALELSPENEEQLKKEIREQLNTRLLENARIREVMFRRLDVTEE